MWVDSLGLEEGGLYLDRLSLVRTIDERSEIVMAHSQLGEDDLQCFSLPHSHDDSGQ